MKAGPRNAPDGADSGGPGGPWSGTWLVLGGGGLKGLAHIGAWRALHEAGIRPEGIVGTSIGALVGALIAGGTTPEQMRAHGLALRRTDIARVNRRAAWINGIRQTSVFRGEPLFAHLEAVLPRRGWNALEIPLLMNAVDLEDGSTEWFGSGARMDVTLAEAVYASSALPVFYPPFETGGHAYVDGGIGGTLPIRKAEEGGAKRIITVDVGAGGKSETRRVLDGGMIAIHQRVVGIMMWERRHEVVSSWEGPPLVYVRPRLAGFGTFDFGHAAHFMDEGYRAMREALASS